MHRSLKPVIWLGDSLRELKTFPAAVQYEMGYAIYLAQCGQKHVSAKPLKGLGSGVLEVVSDHWGHIPFGVHRSVRRPRLCAARVPEEVEARRFDTEADIDVITQRLKQAVALSKKKE